MAFSTTPETWQNAARNRITARWQADDALACWDILRNPDNTVSRQQVRTFSTAAPNPRDSIAVWRAFLDTRFPALAGLLAARDARRTAEVTTSRDAWKREGLTEKATTGPAWQFQGVVYPHAMAFVTHLLGSGFCAVTTGIGTVKFVRADGARLGPYRNAHLNAALALQRKDTA